MDPHPFLRELLAQTIQGGASDLHLVCGTPATVRRQGKLEFLQHEPLSGERTRELILSVLTPQQQEQLQHDWELDFALAVDGVGRFRVCVYRARGQLEAAFRLVSQLPRSIQELGLPAAVADLCRKPSGLILVVGAAGQGKTTTLAAMIDLINRDDRKLRIVTIEDPIEFLHQNINSVIIQREVGHDTKSFSRALVQAMRQDPNVIVVGEMRDLETIGTALMAAETGHLVMATLHSSDCMQTIERVVDVFPSEQQPQIRIQLAASIQGVIAQRLLPRAESPGRVLAVEMLLGSTAVRNTIREGRIHQLTSYLEPSMDRSLKELCQKKLISFETAMAHVRDVQYFRML